MRIYSASSEEMLRARKLLADWAGDGFITKAQYERLEKETASELRITNIFLHGNAAGFLQQWALFSEAPSIGVACCHRRRYIFALDLAPVRTLV